jgi:hypothetical protein
VPTGVEQVKSGFRAALHLRTCVFSTPEAAASARDELVQATKSLRIRQRIRKLEQELNPDAR